MSDTLLVALYARVSSDQQAKSGTIESQIAALKERIAADGEQIAEDLFFTDAGVSGATLIRAQLERLRDRAALGMIDRLYVLSPDRLARKYAHQVLLMEEMSACGVEVVFLNHAIGTTPELMQNGAIRLLGLTAAEIKRQAEDIIFGQLRQVIASLQIEEINRECQDKSCCGACHQDVVRPVSIVGKGWRVLE